MATKTKRRGAQQRNAGGRRAATKKAEPKPGPITPQRSVPEWVWAAGTGAIALVLFLTTFSPRLALGDAPETVAGVDSLGILHAPGYPLYVLAARLFALLIPFGELAFRVNLFSVVCATATVVLTYGIARRLGAARFGAAVGALVLATGASFWFYAGFAKHYPFSALLVATATYQVATWRDGNGTRDQRLWRLVAAALALGLLAGAAWQLAVLALPPLVLLAVWGRRPRIVEVAAPAAVFVLAVAGVVVYTLVRASQDPAVNFGGASTLGRLGALVTMEDFGFGWSTVGTADEAGVSKGVNVEDVTAFPVRMLRYGVLLMRETSVLALLLAGVGVWTLFAAARRARTAAAAHRLAFVLTAVALNLLGAGLVIGLRVVPNYSTVIRQGGFLVGLFIVLAVAVALGVSAALDAARRSPTTPGARVSAVQWVAGTLAALLLVPSVLVHFRWANHRNPGFAEQYAENVWATLPEDAALLVWGYERAFPLLYDQIVNGARPDVTVIAAEALGTDWYQDQVRDELPGPLPEGRDPSADLPDYVDRLRAERPVYLDMDFVRNFSDDVGYRLDGILAEATDGEGSQPVDLDELEERIASYDLDGVYDHYRRGRFPNGLVVKSYGWMHFQAAGLYREAGDEAAMNEHLDRMFQVLDEDASSPGPRR